MKCYSPEKKGGLLESGGGLNQKIYSIKKEANQSTTRLRGLFSRQFKSQTINDVIVLE